MSAVPPTFPRAEDLRPLIDLARREDLGPALDDVTSRLLVPADKLSSATLVQRTPGVSAGLPLVDLVCRAYDERLRVEPVSPLEALEAHHHESRATPLLRIHGPLRSLLAAERVLLNFVQRISGVATLTHRYVKRIEGTRARILDTRKTIPGFRALDKYAVRAGGGQNHRVGLYDGVLVKDNHLAGLPLRDIAPFLANIVRQSRAEDPARLFEVEVDTLDQMAEVLKVENVTVVLLDNMDCPRMEEAVRMRDACALRSRPLLEASGGVNFDTVRPIALTGVDLISVGALTHSAPALDIGLDVEDD